MPDFPPSLSLRIRLRQKLGRLRRSPAARGAIGFLALQARRLRQKTLRRFVRGVWLHTGDYLAHAASERPGFSFPAALPSGRIVIDPPTFARNSSVNSGGGRIVINYPQPVVTVLARPWVVGSDGAIVGRDRRLLWDLSYTWPGMASSHPIYHRRALNAVELPGRTVTLATMAADTNYFHFLLNSLARLAYLDRVSGLEPADRYLVSGPVTAFVADALGLFGIPRHRLIGTAGQDAFRPESLIAPPLVPDPFVVPAEACAFLRRHVLAALPPRSRSRRRILVDRTDAATRRIANLEELRPLLADLDIQPVQLAGLSLAAQAALFNDAELVMASHGAALANVIFCEPGTRVLQILAPGMMEREYRAVSQHARLHHDYVVARFATPADAHLPRKHRDLVLPPRLLRALVADRGSYAATA